jgi:hypothetical protein
VKTEVEAAVLSIYENPNEGTVRGDLRWILKMKQNIADGPLLNGL